MAVVTLPTDFFGQEYFSRNENWPKVTQEQVAAGRVRRMEARRRRIGF